MRLLVTAMVLGAFVSASTVSWALPIKNTGGTRCQCSCRSSNDFKDLDWPMDKACGLSNGNACTFKNYGKPVQSGTLKDCQECRAGETSTEWICKTTWMKSRGTTGTLQLQPAQPGGQSIAPTTPPAQATPH